MAVVQYTFTHKQYTEQHNETEYTERNIHNNKNTETSKRIHNITIRIHEVKHKGKGKSVPLQTRSGPGGSRKLRFPDFTTTA